MGIKASIKTGVCLLMNPEHEFRALHSRTLEDILGEYIKLLLLCGLVAGMFSFAYAIVRAFVLQFFNHVTIDYLRLVNYAAGISTGTFFFYLFSGTFVLFLVCMLLRIFIKHLHFTLIIKILCLSMTPLLFFSWISSVMAFPLLVWSVFLAIVGIRSAHMYGHPLYPAHPHASSRRRR